MKADGKARKSEERNQTILVLLNTGSGKGAVDEEREALITRITDQAGVKVETLRPGDDITKRAAEGVAKGYEIIVAGGGDGTVSGVGAALSGTGTRLGVLPLGTFNFFARSLGLPQDPSEAWGVICKGHSQPVSIGEINGQRFINNASIGAYPTVLKVREDVYQTWGRSRITAYWSVIKAMSSLYRSMRVRLTVDGIVHDLRSPMIFVAVRPYQLEEYGLKGAATIRNEQLVVYLAPGGGRLMLLWRALKMVLRKTERGEDYTMLTGRDITIETYRPRRLVAWDGERDTMSDPFRLTIRENDLSVVVPDRTEAGA